MKKYFAILIVVLIGITYGFNSPVKEENSEISNTKSLPSAEEIEHQHTEIDSIELNNGTKWTIAPEMMAHIRNMESEINRFAEDKHKELKDFTQL